MSADPDKDRGLYGKYRVEKVNGKPVGECFVLEQHDPYAAIALLAYAEACKDEYAPLALDLIEMAHAWSDK